MIPSSTIILGGGFGGLTAAYALRTLLPERHSITVIDQSSSFVVGASKTWVMLGDRNPDHITRSRKSLLPGGVEFLQAVVQGIDLSRGSVATTRGTLRADFLIVALGADVNMGTVPGLDRSAQTFYTLEGAIRLRETLSNFDGGEAVLLIPRTPFKCPPAPYEAALLLHHRLKEQGLLNQTRFSIYTVEPSPMPTAGPEMGAFIRELLDQHGIAYRPLKRVRSIEGDRRAIVFEDGAEAHYDLLIAVPPHEAPRAVRDAGMTNQSGWIPVDPFTLSVIGVQSSVPIYAVGDVTSVPLPGRYHPDTPLVLPKAGVFAASQGAVVAKEIAAAVLGKASNSAFDGKGFCYIETGGRMAVRGEGSFFDLPHPRMSKRSPDNEQYNDKLAWVEQWLSGEGMRQSL